MSAIENSNLIKFCIRSNYANLPLWMDHKFLRHLTHDYLGTFMQTMFKVLITSGSTISQQESAAVSARLPTCLRMVRWAELHDTKISAVILKLIGIDKIICMLCIILMHSPTGKILFKIIELFLEPCFNKVCPGILLQLYFIKNKSCFFIFE